VEEGREEELLRFRARCKRNETITRAEPSETPMEPPTIMVCSLQVLRVSIAGFNTEEEVDEEDSAAAPRLFVGVADEVRVSPVV